MNQLLAVNATNFIAPIIKSGKPESIFDTINLPMRVASRVFPKLWPRTAFVKKNFYFYALFNIWNSLPTEIKLLELKRLKLQAKKYLSKCPDSASLRKSDY